MNNENNNHNNNNNDCDTNREYSFNQKYIQIKENVLNFLNH